MCLDQTFQDVGRWLVKVVDEDPIWRRNLLGSQPCEKIGSIVVLSVALSPMAMHSPLMRASYSMVLFEAKKWRRIM